MTRLNTTTAPDFALQDYHGQSVRLSDYRGDRNVVLVLTGALCDRIAAGIWRSCVKTMRNS